jgi:branched-chain amino acid transport system permease protein
MAIRGLWFWMMAQFQQFLQQLINGLSIGAIYALIAVGYTMVYGVLRLINFAHGDVYMIGAMTGYYAATKWFHLAQPTWLGFVLVLICSMGVCGVLGYFIELLAYRPLRNQPRIVSLITAIGVSMLLEFGGQSKWMFGPDPKPFPDLIPGVEVQPDLVHMGEIVIGKVDALIFLTAILMMFGLRYIVKETKMGLALRAVSYRFDTASLMGVNVNRVISFTFVLGSVMAAAAGVLVGLRSPKVDPLMGLLPGLKAFIAAVLGGIGDIGGAVAGGLLLGVTEAMVVSYFPRGSQYRDGVAFLVLIAILVIKPSGLFGRAAQEKV